MAKKAPARLHYHPGGKATAIRTDDNCPLKNMSRQWGVDVSSRAAVKQREKEGVGFANRKDDALADRARRGNAAEGLRQEIRRDEQGERIRI